jgi:N-acetyl-alpha-D-glucosaminyl L-malate synthase BshA
VRTALELANELGRRGHRVFLFARTAPFGVQAFGPGVRFVGLNGHGAAPATSRLETEWTPRELHGLVERILSVARAIPLDVLHFHYAVPFARVVEEVGRRLGPRTPRLVGTLHGTDVTIHGSRRRTGRPLARWLSGLDAVTTVSRSFAALSTRVFGLPRDPLVIPNFVDLGRFRPGPDARPGRRPRIVHVSNFRPVKNPEMVVQVFARVRREIDAELWLVGDGEGMRSVRELARAAGVAGDVRTFGLRRDVERVLRHTDVLLVTSRSESFCLAALEAAACAVPAVASRVGGLPEVVLHDETGLLYPAGDRTAAAGAVMDLLGDARRRSTLGAAARARADRFSSMSIVSRYEQLYRGLAGSMEPSDITEAVG